MFQSFTISHGKTWLFTCTFYHFKSVGIEEFKLLYKAYIWNVCKYFFIFGL